MQIHWSRNGRRDTRSAVALAVLLLGGAAACETVASPEISPVQNVAEGTGAISGQVQDLEGRPVAGARIRVPGGAQTVTDAAGQFRLTGLAATPRLAVSVDAPGFDGTSAIYEVRGGVELARPIRIQPLAPPVVIPAGAGGSVPIAGGGEVRIPANAFAGVAAGEPVTVSATYISTQNAAQFSTAPGDFTARTFSGDPTQLVSFGMLSVAATNAQGQPLDLAAGQQATLRFPLAPGTGGGTVPVWTFDPQTGIWVEEGAAVVTPTSIDVNVSSLTPRRNLDKPFRPVCIAVRVLRADKVTPRPNEWVSATGISYAGFTQGWTGTAGVVQLQVPPSQQTLVQSGPAQQAVNTPPAGTTGCPLVATFAF